MHLFQVKYLFVFLYLAAQKVLEDITAFDVYKHRIYNVVVFFFEQGFFIYITFEN